VNTSEAPCSRALLLVRVACALIIIAHGAYRLANGGVTPFAQWLAGQGVPAAIGIAWGVTLFELGGSVLLALGRVVRTSCLVFISVYAVGIVLVHAPAGWFVVGPGRNGAEFSVLLIVCLTAIAIAHPSRRAT
jgi:putative oxidoreductase